MEESTLVEMYGMVMETNANVKNLVGRFDVLESEHKERSVERTCYIEKHESAYHSTQADQKKMALDIIGKVAQWLGVGTAIVIAILK